MLIYDMAGRMVRSIQTQCAEGLNEVIWDGCNSSGNSIANGVYYLKFTAEAENESVVKYLKMAVLR
jgi:flagellar hook assembly protein FlgD